MLIDPSADFFQSFGLERVFDVDLAALTAAFRRHQQAVHPDRFSSATDAHKRAALQASGYLNDAFTTLSDPLSRAVYLLRLRGIDPLAQTDTRVPAAVLMRQMALREDLEAAQALGAVQASDALEALLAGVDADILALTVRLSADFAADQPQAARDDTRELQFLYKLRISVDDALAGI